MNGLAFRTKDLFGHGDADTLIRALMTEMEDLELISCDSGAAGWYQFVPEGWYSSFTLCWTALANARELQLDT